jgi:methionyl-tRNA formyltransferase
MRIIFFGNGSRGLNCLETLLKNKFTVDLIVLHPNKEKEWLAVAREHNLPIIAPEDPNEKSVLDFLKSKKADVFVLAGYGKIFKNDIIRIPSKAAINLHGGKLPKYRGSSPMNWALIKGEKTFTLSIIKVDGGVDTGDVLIEKTFAITPNDTIVDLHKIADREFPKMLIEVLKKIKTGKAKGKKQTGKASYYPLRFPDDGLLFFDEFTAEEIHNRIRALTEPYPCALTIFNGKKVKLISSALSATPHYGDPGRVYRKTDKGLLVCAKDQCLWITKAVMEESGESLFDHVNRYERLVTLRHLVLNHQH